MDGVVEWFLLINWIKCEIRLFTVRGNILGYAYISLFFIWYMIPCTTNFEQKLSANKTWGCIYKFECANLTSTNTFTLNLPIL